MSFTAEKRRHQRRTDAEASPYINHPIGLTKLLHEAGVSDPVVLCAALLHDPHPGLEREFDRSFAARPG